MKKSKKFNLLLILNAMLFSLILAFMTIMIKEQQVLIKKLDNHKLLMMSR